MPLTNEQRAEIIGRLTPEQLEILGERIGQKIFEIREAEAEALHLKHGTPIGLLAYHRDQ